MNLVRLFGFIVAFSLSTGLAWAERYSNVVINGQLLTVAEVNYLQQQIGMTIEPGYYLVDPSTGCWLNQSTGASGCLISNATQYQTPHGSGWSDGNGNWNHYDSYSRWGVGGTADGCIYTPEWSNC